MLNSLLIILEQFLLYLPLMLGAYCSIALMKVTNLAIESAFVFGAILAHKISVFYCGFGIINLLISIGAGMIGGMIAGLTTSAIKINFKLSDLLSAIITIGLFSGINQYVLGIAHASINYNNLILIKSMAQFPSLTTLIAIISTILVLFIIFLKTELGISCRIYGNNNKFFDKFHISSKWVFFCGMGISGSLAGISGYLISQTNGFVDMSMGIGISLLCITTIIIGKTIANHNSILIPIAGTFAYFIIQQSLLKVGFNLQYFNMIQALVILIKAAIARKKRICDSNSIEI